MRGYVEKAMRTNASDHRAIIKRIKMPGMIDMIHACLGMCTEVGEFTDNVKKFLFYGKPLDFVNAKEELGDLTWYIACAVRVLKTTLDDILSCNIKKLKKRYPDCFTEEKALSRNIKKELTVFKKKGK